MVLSAWRVWLSVAAFSAAAYLSAGFLRERLRRSRLTERERFLEGLSALIGSDFPLARYERSHPKLVARTRSAVYSGTGADDRREFDRLSDEWKKIVRA